MNLQRLDVVPSMRCAWQYNFAIMCGGKLGILSAAIDHRRVVVTDELHLGGVVTVTKANFAPSGFLLLLGEVESR